MTQHRRRIDIVLGPEYLDGLDSITDDDLQAMHEECMELETEVSYVRRPAPPRIEILNAERDRRETGGSVAALIAAPPKILADPGPRPDPASSRLSRHLAPAPSIQWTRGREPLIVDDTLANLPTLTNEQLETTLGELGELEREVSQRRRALHGVIDGIEAELARRRVNA